jgi:hypothetical protein
MWLRFHNMKANMYVLYANVYVLHVLAPIVIADVRGVRELAGEGAYHRSHPADR